MQKVEKMKQKTKTVIDLFNIPDTENVIQDYRCSMKSDEDGSGKLFITQNYLLFAGNNNKVLVSNCKTSNYTFRMYLFIIYVFLRNQFLFTEYHLYQKKKASYSFPLV